SAWIQFGHDTSNLHCLCVLLHLFQTATLTTCLHLSNNLRDQLSNALQCLCLRHPTIVFWRDHENVSACHIYLYLLRLKYASSPTPSRGAKMLAKARRLDWFWLAGLGPTAVFCAGLPPRSAVIIEARPPCVRAYS